MANLKLRGLAAIIMCIYAVAALPVREQPLPRSSELPLPSINEIVARLVSSNSQRNAALPAYRGLRSYAVDYRGIAGNRRAAMTVSVEYSPSRGKTFRILSEEGSKLLLSRVLHRALESERQAASPAEREHATLGPQNYRFELLSRQVLGERPCFLLRVRPRRKDKFLYDGRIWVDAEDFAVTRIEATPAKNPSFWISHVTIQHQYAKFGEFWLPASHQSTSHVRLGGSARLTVEYSRYELSSPGGNGP